MDRGGALLSNYVGEIGNIVGDDTMFAADVIQIAVVSYAVSGFVDLPFLGNPQQNEQQTLDALNAISSSKYLVYNHLVNRSSMSFYAFNRYSLFTKSVNLRVLFHVKYK